MTEPTIRTYDPSDYPEVVTLLRSHDYRVPDQPEEFEGIALVAHEPIDEEDPGKIPRLIGFIWALAADASPVAYTDHFVVDREYRASGVGVKLVLVLRKILQLKGIRKMIGVTPPGNSGFLRMLRKRGVEIVPNHAVLIARMGVLVEEEA